MQNLNLVRSFRVMVLLTALCILTGCGRQVATNKIKSDGSWDREVVYHAGLSTMQDVDKPFDVYVIPKAPLWKITKGVDEKETMITAKRSLKITEVIKGDLTLQDVKTKKPLVTNEASIKEIAPNKFQYTEVIRWAGPLPKDLISVSDDQVIKIKSILPQELATQVNARAIGLRMNREFWKVLFGPNDPLISNYAELLTSPEGLFRKLAKKIGKSADAALIEVFGNKMTLEQRHTFIRKYSQDFVETSEKEAKKADPTSKPDSKLGDLAPIALHIAIQLPGKIVETNGNKDDYLNEVFWTFYPHASAVEEVKLTATYEITR